MSFFNNMLDGPLYCLICETDETGNRLLDTAEVLEVWAAFADGTLIYKDTSESPWKLEYLRLGDDPVLYFTKGNAELALEKLRNAQ
jgi:hypothetical protein